MAFTQQPLIPSNYKMKLIKDLGQVPSKGNPNRSYRHAIFECPICNTHFECRATGTKAHNQESCGVCAKTKHNLYKHPLYPIWNGIIQRCYNTKRKDYPRYGGAGVTVFSLWKDSPLEFITWCEANGWEPGLVVDKDIKSKELGLTIHIYSPDTVSFITTQENAHEANAKTVLQFTLDGILLNEYSSCTSAALSLGKPKAFKSAIANACRGTTKSSLGFIWQFK